MRLCAIFLILNLQQSLIFAVPPNSLESSPQTRRNLEGYECGDRFFTDVDVKEALLIARHSIDLKFPYPLKYRGPLYSESHYEDYFLYPVRNGRQYSPESQQLKKTVSYIIFTRNSIKEVDVVSKTTVGDYTKCIRRDSKHIWPLYSVPENANGYMCGSKFFDDEIIGKSLALAQIKAEGITAYPSPYNGRLYPENSGYLKWPIMNGEKLYASGSATCGPYFLILNNQRQLVDVVVKGFRKNLLRCTRSRMPPKAPASDPQSKIFVQPPKYGYICGKAFFEDEALKKIVHTFTEKASITNKNKFFIVNTGPPFNEPYLMWPLEKDGRLYTKGSTGPYRLILTPGFEVLGVAIFVNGKLKACDRRTVKVKKNHDTSSYHCNVYQFSHQQLVLAAEEACSKMNPKSSNFYPARYHGSGFNLDGPYLTYPVFAVGGRKFRSHTGLHRVVINLNCEVVGALTTIPMSISDGPSTSSRPGLKMGNRLVKCHRLDDGPLPQGFFDDNVETVFENSGRY